MLKTVMNPKPQDKQTEGKRGCVGRRAELPGGTISEHPARFNQLPTSSQQLWYFRVS